MERDRDPTGRPRNARPRDDLGRPLPRDAAAAYVEVEPPQDPDEALAEGIAHFDAGRFFQAHEMWEGAWHRADAPERDFWQGITQIAVGFTHAQRGNAHGATTLLRRGARRLAAYGPEHRGFPVARLREAAARAAERIERDGLVRPVDVPRIGE